MSRLLLHAALLLPARLALGRVLRQTEPTPSAYDAIDDQGWTPKPTQAPIRPRYAAMDVGQLFGRQDAGETCAYISGHADAPFTCYSDAACIWFNSPSPSYLACCSTDPTASTLSILGDCGPASACIPYASNNLDEIATDALTTSNIVYCPANSPTCGTVIITGTASTDGEYSFYSCGTTNASVVMYGYTTDQDVSFNGPTVVTTNPAPQTVTLTQNVTIVPSSNVGQTTPTVLTGLPITATKSILAHTSTSNESSSPTSTAPVSTSSSASSTPKTSHTDAGAIAGGTVGGVAVLALVAGTIAYLVRRKQNQRKAPLPEISQYGSTPKLT